MKTLAALAALAVACSQSPSWGAEPGGLRWGTFRNVRLELVTAVSSRASTPRKQQHTATAR